MADQQKLTIAFDASDLCAGQADGTTRYTFELARRLPELGKKYVWELMAQCNVPEMQLPKLPANARWTGSPWPRFWTQSKLAFDLFRRRPDVLFMPIQQLPFIRPPRMKTVAIIHDLAFFEYPEQTAYRDWLLLNMFGSLAVREADALIAVSESTKRDIERVYGRVKGVHVVHHGLNHTQFRLPDGRERRESWELLQQRYPRLRKPYLLYVGQIQPRKNLVRLMKAFETLCKKDSDLQLAMSGGHGWLQRPIFERAEASPARENIEFLGRVPDEFLAPLYWHAEAFVLPALYEGFGMPILEAMACGCPVVTSDASSMGEVAGGAAVLIDPKSAESIAEGIVQARGRKSALAKLGIERSRGFTWERAARETLAVIEGLYE